MNNKAVEKRPAYVTITERLRDGVVEGTLAAGTVLLEGPLAEIFGSSRAPVKQALSILEDEGLVSRFSGRGLIVCGGAPKRIKLTAELLGLAPDMSAAVKSFAWQSFYYSFERDLTLHSLVGTAKVNELALARCYGFGRTVAKDLLLRAQLAGLVEKGDDARWSIVALDEQRFTNLYELRILLEPAALITAAHDIPGELLDRFQRRLEEAARHFPNVDQTTLDQLENDLHVECLSFARNVELTEALRRSRPTLVAGKHIQVALGRTPRIDAFIDDHLAVIDAIRKRKFEEGAQLLSTHLRSSALKAQDRLRSYRKIANRVTPIYIID